MKLIVEGLDLSVALGRVIKAIPGKPLDPILGGVKLSAKGELLTLFATDGELSIESSVHAEIIKEGEAIVEGKSFLDIARTLGNEQIELGSIDEKTLNIRYSESNSNLQTMNIDDYPEISLSVNENSFVIKQKKFKELINDTVFSAATDYARPILKGCLIEVENGLVKSVALDSYRMAICCKKVVSSSDNFSKIVPARALNEICRLLENDDEELSLKFNKSYMIAKTVGTKVITRLFDGDFINYRQIAASEFTSTVRVNREQFISSIERASVVARQNSTNFIKLDIKEKNMVIGSTSVMGNVVENIPVVLDGRDDVIAFNPKYLLDALKAIEEDFITIYLQGAVGKPAIIKNLEEEFYFYLILPVRLFN